MAAAEAQAAANQDAAKKVIDRINALPAEDAFYEMEDGEFAEAQTAIKDAQIAYEALTGEQKDLVTNYDKLKALLEALDAVSEDTAVVARIYDPGVEGAEDGGYVYYDDLDTAVEAAGDGATIELLADATTAGLDLSKELTIRAAEGLEETPTITFTQYGIALWGKALTFKNVDIVMKGIGSTPYTAEWYWMTIGASAGASLTLDNVDMMMDGTGTAKGESSTHAIYFTGNNKLNLVNKSVLEIKNYSQDALEWDGGNGGYNVNITDSTFISDHNRSGFTGTFYATITNSKVDVINSTGNGSNGSHFIIEDSEVNFSDNGSHGLSAGVLKIKNSTVTAKDNGGIGITVNNELEITDESNITVTGNCYKTTEDYAYAAVRLYNDFTFTVDNTSELYIKDNNNTGLYVRQGKLNVANGSILEITGNIVKNNLLDGYGGGIYLGYGDNYDPTVSLPADAVIYNNHSLTGGDDIYISQGVNGPNLIFGEVGEGWHLDGAPDCTDPIDGWYDDSKDARWQAHAEVEDDNHAVVFDDFTQGLATVTGLTFLKAAHAYIPPEPEPEPEPEPPEWDFSKSKTAINLDENFESQVTLSLPAAEEELVSDVVFVLDKSTSTAVEDEALEMLSDLQKQIQETGATVKVGVVIFNKEANRVLELTDLTKENMAAIAEAFRTQISSGTNMNAGLLAGKEMLDEDTSVDANRKYLIFVSDGISYMYGAEPLIVPYYWINDGRPYFSTDPYSWQLKYGNNNPPENWDTLLTEIGSILETESITAVSYDRKDSLTMAQGTAVPENMNYTTSVDRSLYYTYGVYSAAQEQGYHCYAITMDTTTEYLWGPSFMDYLSGDKEVSFDSIQNDIYYLLDAGSSVEDYMGYVADEYNFDFVNDASKLTLKVGEATYTAQEIDENQYGFAPDGEGGYDYILTYDRDDGKGGEHFVWEINVPVSNFAPVQLTYTVKLVNPKTEPNTYGEYDHDGSKNYDGLYTNNSATLYPVDSNGDGGIPENFPKPTVSYTVEKPTWAPSQSPRPLRACQQRRPKSASLISKLLLREMENTNTSLLKATRKAARSPAVVRSS